MKPVAFDYFRAENAAQAVAALRDVGDDARILAGGQSLMAVLNMRLAQPRLLIDISRTPDLRTVTVTEQRLVIGAAVTQAEVEWRPTLADEVPLLPMVFPSISHFQIRNKGTVCGSVAHADPSAELPLALATLQGDIVLRNAQRERIVPVNAFFAGMLMTARASDELITAVRFPLHEPGSGYGFKEFAVRHGDFAIVAIAAVARAQTVTVGVGGVADRPIVETWPWPHELASGARNPAENPNVEPGAAAPADVEVSATLSAALNDLAWRCGASDDAHISAAYRRHLVRTLGDTAVRQALADRLARLHGHGSNKSERRADVLPDTTPETKPETKEGT